MVEALQTLQQKVENEFWEVLIPWLEENPRVRTLVNAGYRFQEQFVNRNSFIAAAMVSSLGLMLGLGIGCILAFLI